MPLEAPYDYLVPAGVAVAPGDFVRVPLGSQERIGVVWQGALVDGRAAVAPEKLRSIIERIDAPPLPLISLEFAEWVARYTLSPPGMVLAMMMSARQAFAPPKPRFGYRLEGSPPGRLTRARARVLEAAANGLVWPKSALAEAAGVGQGIIDGLAAAGTLVKKVLPPEAWPQPDPGYAGVELSGEQAAAAAALRGAVMAEAYSVTLLDGVTGAGKTEVYFEAVAQALEAGKQALVLLPEIALTSQFIDRFEARFGARPVEWHSEITPHRRGRAWRAVARGEARVVVGARSALFLPFRNLGLIVVDEEHESAFKQADRVIYQGRDMSVVRGALGGVPVVLSSATPSIESHVNADEGRYKRLRLQARFAGATLPKIEAIDLREHPPERGRWMSPVLVERVTEALTDQQQALLFLNRRGYAPLTLCRVCGYRFECPHCSVWLVEHRFRNKLQCHHCGASVPVPNDCPQCGAEDALVSCGPGVERIAEEVFERYPDARIAILSSDLVPNMAALRAVLEQITQGRADIVIGTQLVAKGHHFPGLAVVGVIDGDLGLNQGDPRAAERTYQLLHQLTGRAGREVVAGFGYIQTYRPDHPVVEALVSGDRDRFISQEAAAREQAAYPPFGRLAALIVSARSGANAQGFARALVRAAPAAAKITVLGPAEAPLAVVSGRHRMRILVKAARETDLQAYLRAWLARAPALRGGVRLTVDVDPYNFL